MPPERVVVELAPWTQQLPQQDARQLRRRFWAGIVVGGLLVVLALAGAAALFLIPPQPGAWCGVGLLLLVGGLLCWQGRRRLRRLSPGGDGTPVQLAAPYAFAIEAGVLELPAHQGQPAERWPLRETTVEAGRHLGSDVLRLSCPGRRTRRYPARGLRLTPAAVAELVTAQRSTSRD